MSLPCPLVVTAGNGVMDELQPISGSNQDALTLSQQTPIFLRKHKLETPLLPVPLPLLSSADTIEQWTRCEKLMLAALRVGDDKAAFQCLERMIQRFGATDERVMGLRGLYQESVAENQKALESVLKEYEDVLAEDPVNIAIRKRRIALLQTLSRTTDAIGALVDLLDISPSDPEAWIELAELYHEQCLFSQAQFCFEEALTIVPTAWNLHARLGEVLYISAAQSGESTVLTILCESLRRFCRSIELCDDYLRGYYGLKMVTDRLLELMGRDVSLAKSGEAKGVPSQETIKRLNEKAMLRLLAIIKSGQHSSVTKSELNAAKQLVEKTAQKTIH